MNGGSVVGREYVSTERGESATDYVLLLFRSLIRFVFLVRSLFVFGPGTGVCLYIPLIALSLVLFVCPLEFPEPFMHGIF